MVYIMHCKTNFEHWLFSGRHSEQLLSETCLSKKYFTQPNIVNNVSSLMLAVKIIGNQN